MGAFFTNVQVRNQSESTWNSLLDALVESASSEGMDVAEGGTDSDRSVVLIPGEKWISVYEDDDLLRLVVQGLLQALVDRAGNHDDDELQSRREHRARR